MTELKTWMVYLAGIIIVVSFPLALLVNLGDPTGEGIGYDVGRMLGISVILGGGILLIYYAIKLARKKKKK